MNILDTIGHTPLIFLDKVSASLPAKIHVKYEARNPGGSIKDRAAAGYLQAALASGEYGQVLRAKGIVDGGSDWLYFDYVPDEPDVRTGAPGVTGRLCVIGCQLEEEKLKALFLG